MDNLRTHGEEYFLKWSSLRWKNYHCVINLSNKIDRNERSSILK